MHIVKIGILILFKLTCFVLVGHMVYLQFQEYVGNYDVSSVYYKKFNDDKDDVYPTFSVCLVLYDGQLFRDSLGNLSRSYWRFIRGLQENDTNIYSKINFDEVIIDLRRQLHKYQRKTKYSGRKYVTEKFFDFDHTFQVTHQDPNRICFTKKENQEKGRMFKYDLLKINSGWLDSLNVEGHVYLHHKGQLIRTLGKPTVTLRGASLHQGKLKNHKGYQYVIRMRNNAVEVLRKRPNAVKRCNVNLLDDDSQWRQSVIKAVSCIPTFMRRFELNAYLQKLSLPECNQDQYRKIEDMYAPYDNFETASKLYIEPCTQMSSVVTTTESLAHYDNSNSTILVLKFDYTEDYRETVNKRAFGFTTLWSQIGGFIGIIIGYSVMQIPKTLEELFIWAKSSLGQKKPKYNAKKDHVNVI